MAWHRIAAEMQGPLVLLAQPHAPLAAL